MKSIIDKNLQPTYFLDFDSQIIKDFINKNTNNAQSQKDKIISLYYAVRDQIKYDPYHIVFKKENIRSSSVIQRKYGYCVEKAMVLVTCARAIGVPARIGFANVKNHLTSKRLYDLMKSDIFVFHGYSDLFIDEKWIKATPAFNLSLCERTNTLPLDFDAENHSIFHSIDKEGKKHMEYIYDYGSFDDLPFEKMLEEYNKFYPHLDISSSGTFGPVKVNIDFESEATQEVK